MKRRYTFALTLGVALCGQRANAQMSSRQWDITHTIHMPNTPILGTDSVRAQYFDHTWVVHPFGQGGDEWEAAPPWTQPPTWPNPQQQPAGFDPYGTEILYHWNNGNSSYGPYAGGPMNTCVPGFNFRNPCWNNTWPLPANPMYTGWLVIFEQGTGPGWNIEVDVPTWPPTFARSEVEVQPFTLGSGLLDARIRSAGADHVTWGSSLEHTYAFSWTQLIIGRHIRPQQFPAPVGFNWNLQAAIVAGSPTNVPTTWWPTNVGPLVQRFYDPITFVLTDVATGATRSGELFQLVVELDGGWCDANNGFLALDTQDGGLRVRMDHPFISPRGTLDIEIASGQVVTSRATGYFASMALPPIGTSPPLAISFPSSSFDFVFDATSVFPGDHDVEFYMGGAGGEHRPASLATGACCDSGLCSSGVLANNCAAAGGTWQGAGTACPDVPYAVEEFRGGFEDIALFGVPSVAGNCDDCGETVPLGFDLNYFGSTFSDVGISSNGYLAFTGPLDVYLNQPIPNAGGPENLLAGYWDDLYPIGGGDVHYATLGVVPNRRFIAQWTDVPHFLTDYPLHTFQIVLHEGTNEIEYVYLDTPVVGGAISPTIGIENGAGSAGLALDADSLTPKGSRRFVPAPGITCPPPSAVSYCTPGTTTNGCTANMSATGTPSASSSSGFVVSSTDIEGLKQGILFYGISGSAAFPWGAGSTSVLCVKAPYQRSNAQSSGGTIGQCNGAMSLDLLAYLATHPGALGTPFVSGQQCWLQCWFRDPPAPNTTSLSDGLEVTFQP